MFVAAEVFQSKTSSFPNPYQMILCLNLTRAQAQ